jgi:hypothetical protein
MRCAPGSNSTLWKDHATGDSVDLAIAAGVLELLASRWGQAAPDWTGSIPALLQPFFLVKAAAWLPRLRKTCEEEGPERFGVAG